ncbi:hypothetical protein TNCV_1330801 [Trichonephila clavipes]|uniref:Uncharacterized protein n=1 Tax=Trichonephila clavipes TaxID=2585209 RepID=A0A8X6R368_TRICX|nr:hypothetical protein TNCV_1330801 [Trichonephila clavipes]
MFFEVEILLVVVAPWGSKLSIDEVIQSDTTVQQDASWYGKVPFAIVLTSTIGDFTYVVHWLHRELCETRLFYVTRQDDSRRRAVRCPGLEESILNVVPDRPEYKSCCSSSKC